MSNIRLLIFTVAIFSALYSNSGAQTASDPHAVDLGNSLLSIDSSHDYLNTPPVDLGDLNGDGNDDLLLGKLLVSSDSQWTDYHVGLMNGVAITSSYPFSNGAYGVSNAIDLNGDGRSDLISYRRNVTSDAFETFVNWGITSAPFIGQAQTRLIGNPDLGHNQLSASADVNGDGEPELITHAGGVRAFLYKGFHDGPSLGSLLPYDSLELRDAIYHNFLGLTTGKMQSASDVPGILVASSGWSAPPTALFKITYLPNPGGNGSFNTTPGIVVFSDTIPHSDLFIYSAPFAVCDITGDGIDDLIVSDSNAVYIFKGGASFGSQTLTKRDADVIIKSPALLDPQKYGRLTAVPLGLTCVADLNGSHLPYLIVTYAEEGVISREHSFFYAGGSALDTYYDAVISATSSSVPVFLSISLPNSQRGLVYTDANTSYLVQGLDNVPHHVFSSVSSSSATLSLSFSASYVSNKLKLTCSGGPAGRYVVTLCDLLGRMVMPPTELTGGGTYTIPTPTLPLGAYFVHITGEGGNAVVRLICE